MASRRRVHWVFWALGVASVMLVLWALLHGSRPKPTGSRPVPVTTVTARSGDVPITLTALGAAQAWTSDTILAQVSGKLIAVDFTEGSYVRAGQLLAQVDPAPYRAVLIQAQGALARDQAQLAGARVDLTRYQTLAKQDSVARQTLENQAALVAQDAGTVELDRGAVAAARVNLNWTRIVSPISGRTGVRLVDPGNLVSAGGSAASVPATAAATNNTAAPTGASSGGTGIVVVNQIEPIAVTFTVPQGDFQRLSDLSDGFRKPLAVAAFSQENNTPLGSGELSIADNRVDPATGTVELKARFANVGERLWPGQFVNVRLTLQTLHGATTIPVTAVNRGPAGPFVFVVGPNHKASMRSVIISSTQGSTAIVQSGVRPGDIVVTDGQMILKAGSVVTIARPPPAAPVP